MPKHRRVRHIHDHQAIERLDALESEAPSDQRPPIVPNQKAPARAAGVEQRGYVGDQVL